MFLRFFAMFLVLFPAVAYSAPRSEKARAGAVRAAGARAGMSSNTVAKPKGQTAATTASVTVAESQTEDSDNEATTTSGTNT